MISSSLQNALKTFIKEALGTSVSSLEHSAVGGGSINKTYRILINGKQKLFCKINSASSFPGMFEKEKSGLELLAAEKIIRAPKVFGSFLHADNQVLVLEWIEQGPQSASFWRRFGEQLAALHSIPRENAGWHEDNYMGALPQSNSWSPDWIAFFIHQRLEPQVQLAYDKKLLQPQHRTYFEKVYKALPAIFPAENFSMLHGDLWSGNFLCDDAGSPVLIDPAVYHGYRSIDLGMTTLFGGFDPTFYEAYNCHFPFPSNHREQWEVCNLYPLLIHLNLFGKGYLNNILSIVQYY
jgi:fructosamine-3-kinase